MPGDRAQVTLLGPQRRPTLDQVVRDLPPSAPLVTVTAGWQEREPDVGELHGLLARPCTNLGLYGRWQDVQERDPSYAAAELDHRAVLAELRHTHLVQLESALEVLYALLRRTTQQPRAYAAAVADAEAVVRLVDSSHLDRVRNANGEFAAAWVPAHRSAVAEHRAEVGEHLARSAGLVVAGGHVGDLLVVLRLFDVAARVPPVVLAWSAGAMTLTERVVLFHDRAPQGAGAAEVHDDGLGLLPGVVALPHARRRLRTDDRTGMAVLASRFAPARCVVLDDGMCVRLTGRGRLPPSARVISPDGRIVALEEL